MNLIEFENRFLKKREKNLEKYIRLRNRFLSRRAEAEKDFHECQRIIGELGKKLGWKKDMIP